MDRRKFSKLIAGAVTAVIDSISEEALASSDPRIKAWKLLDESEQIFRSEGSSPAYLAKTDELFAFMESSFLPRNPENYESDIQEIRTLIRDNSNFDFENCSDAAFSAVIVQHGLVKLKIPMTLASRWREFTTLIAAITLPA